MRAGRPGGGSRCSCCGCPGCSCSGSRSGSSAGCSSSSRRAGRGCRPRPLWPVPLRIMVKRKKGARLRFRRQPCRTEYSPLPLRGIPPRGGGWRKAPGGVRRASREEPKMRPDGGAALPKPSGREHAVNAVILRWKAACVHSPVANRPAYASAFRRYRVLDRRSGNVPHFPARPTTGRQDATTTARPRVPKAPQGVTFRPVVLRPCRRMAAFRGKPPPFPGRLDNRTTGHHDNRSAPRSEGSPGRKGKRHFPSWKARRRKPPPP